MMRRMSVAQVKRDLGKVLDAAERGERTVVLRHDRPIATISPYNPDQSPLPEPRAQGGLLALAGALADWDTMEEDMAQVIAERQFTKDRAGPDFDAPELVSE